MPLEPLEPQRAYQRIANQIADLVRRGEFAAGEQLPAERDLAKQLAVSRNVVREALVALELSKIVEVRVGVGAFVLPTSSWEAMDLMSEVSDQGPSPFQLLQTRRMLEGEVAYFAAAMATDQDCADLEECVSGIENNTQQFLVGTPGFHWDRKFHVRLAETTRNSVLVTLVENLFDGIGDPIFTRLQQQRHLPRSPEERVSNHRNVFERVAAGDAPGARAAMHRHFDNVSELLFGDRNALVDGQVQERK